MSTIDNLRREWRWTGAACLLLLLWELSGLDLAAAQLFGSATGFAARNSWWASTLLHDGGRAAAWALLMLLVLALLRGPAGACATPARRDRALWLAVALLSVLFIPAIKHFSTTSCPWDLAEFGGPAHPVSHWRWGVADGGGGHCFPSGHAVAAVGFFGQYFLWRPHQMRRALGWLGAVLAVGVLFGLAQLARGAHFVSHTLWSAALCWLIALTVAQARLWWRGCTMRAGTAAGAPFERERLET
jgi:membrane-associated PAP2 superfamily phosphatase